MEVEAINPPKPAPIKAKGNSSRSVHYINFRNRTQLVLCMKTSLLNYLPPKSLLGKVQQKTNKQKTKTKNQKEVFFFFYYSNFVP